MLISFVEFLAADMKGKIRVYARWRPLSEKEIREHQKMALQSPDEFTVEHPWKDEKKQHQFDHVFDDVSTQDMIFEDTKVLACSGTLCRNRYSNVHHVASMS